MVVTTDNAGCMVLTFNPDEQKELRHMMQRALNCMDPQAWPHWARVLDQRFEQMRRDQHISANLKSD